MMMTLWRFLAAKKVALELVTPPIAPDRLPVMLVHDQLFLSTSIALTRVL